MKKIITLFAILAITTSVFAQTDSTKKEKIEFSASLTLMSRNYSRGMNFGDGISIQPNVEASYKKVTFGVFGALTNNVKYNYGTTFSTYLSYKVKNFTFSVYDYFFVNKIDSLNDYGFQTGKAYLKDSLQTNYREGHYLEGMIKYSTKKLYIIAAYNFYNTTCNIYKNTVYLEGKYMINDNFGFALGFTTGASNLNFYTDKYNNGVGFTCIGLDWHKSLKITQDFSTDMRIRLRANPNYKNIAPSLQQTPFNMILSLAI